MPKISIVIPYYEASQWLPETLKSIEKQTCQDYEIIIVDDGSIKEPLKKYLPATQSPNMRILIQKNMGLATTRNRGIKTARGKYIVPLDADDLIKPTFLEECVKLFDEKPNTGIAYTGFIYFGKRNAHSRLQQYDFYLLLQDNFIPATAMYRKQVWEQVGGYSEDMVGGCEDWEFWISAGEKGWYGELIPRYLFLYRQTKNSMYEKTFLRQKSLRKLIRQKHKNLYSSDNLSRIENQWGPHKKISTRSYYLIKHLIINDFVPSKIQWHMRNLYYKFRS